MSAQVVTIDVREDLKSGREPRARIMDAVSRLREGESLRVIAPFEPRPLINLLTMQGFTATPTQAGSGEWEVLFKPSAQTDDTA